MVLPIIIAVVAAPGLLGTQEAIRQSQAKEKREEHRARRCNLIATCVKSSLRSREINGRPIVLKNGKLYIDTGTSDGESFGHPYAGYYLPYPDEKYEGLVTTITDEAPIMNWVYVDKETYELKYGVRVNAQPNFTGPFDCTRQDRRLTFDGWEGWCAVEEFPTIWSLYFDKDDDGLRSKVAEGTRVLEVELMRKEKKWVKEIDARQQDQTTKRAVDVKEDAPMDKPITEEPQLDPPGVGVSLPEPLKIPKSIFAKAPPSPEPVPPPKTPPPETPPSAGPATSTPSPSSDPPGRLNRKRGSRALAQAQMFEQMGQKSTPLPPKNGKLPIRRTSGASDISESGTNGNAPVPYSTRPDSSILTPSAPAPAARQEPEPKALTSDPAIFGGMLGGAPGRPPQPNRLRYDPNSNNQYPLRRKDSALTDNEPPQAPLPRVPTSPTKRRPISPNKGVPPLPRFPASSGARRPISPEKNRAVSPEKRRLFMPKDSQKATPKSTPKNQPNKLTKRSPTSPTDRRPSTSSKDGDSKSSPRPLARTATAPPRVSMANTMTTGEKGSMHRSMASSGGSEPSSADRPSYERTTSNLYRELDDILKPGQSTGRARGATVPSNSQGNGRVERPVPPNRPSTSKEAAKTTNIPRSPLQRMFSIARTASARKKEDRKSGEPI
ncbi:uncharacterized protein BDR25DRAFT_23662 [Lindgomyces ingoldianus]|uniref:Uncharacterized protein n=1 Tax=Lindgomyces ingoldianus TaxID=673940 RepID=A0ACB6QZ77_9PLEO|nr:uncharacterized protein BDR25DRAFT_23662 [Lindgomyces ingoldianus]KAF2471850.1 hypothetical protein BDR25DRAFT_23662 [Lindgomyces ingoldianus]